MGLCLSMSGRLVRQPLKKSFSLISSRDSTLCDCDLCEEAKRRYMQTVDGLTKKEIYGNILVGGWHIGPICCRLEICLLIL
jgi:hypothetical protein